MREIKFRVWDSKSKKMSLPFDVKKDWGDWLIDFDEYSADGASEEMEWLQYTGLKDKNGVEIYEGDIVRIGTLEGEPLGAIEWVDKYAQYEINDNARYKFGGEYVEHHRAKSFEVIGNIYENSELLK